MAIGQIAAERVLSKGGYVQIKDGVDKSKKLSDMGSEKSNSVRGGEG